MTSATGPTEGYKVLMISDALGATEVIALEKVRATSEASASDYRSILQSG